MTRMTQGNETDGDTEVKPLRVLVLRNASRTAVRGTHTCAANVPKSRAEGNFTVLLWMETGALKVAGSANSIPLCVENSVAKH